MLPTCPIHPTVSLRCPACAGSKGGLIGGKQRSAKKTRAARKNAKLPRKRHTKLPHGTHRRGLTYGGGGEGPGDVGQGTGGRAGWTASPPAHDRVPWWTSTVSQAADVSKDCEIAQWKRDAEENARLLCKMHDALADLLAVERTDGPDDLSVEILAGKVRALQTTLAQARGTHDTPPNKGHETDG